MKFLYINITFYEVLYKISDFIDIILVIIIIFYNNYYLFLKMGN